MILVNWSLLTSDESPYYNKQHAAFSLLYNQLISENYTEVVE